MSRQDEGDTTDTRSGRSRGFRVGHKDQLASTIESARRAQVEIVPSCREGAGDVQHRCNL